jgi:hypothetical protein
MGKSSFPRASPSRRTQLTFDHDQFESDKPARPFANSYSAIIDAQRDAQKTSEPAAEAGSLASLLDRIGDEPAAVAGEDLLEVNEFEPSPAIETIEAKNGSGRTSLCTIRK